MSDRSVRRSDLEFVVRLPQWSEHARPEGFRRIARAAEDYGFDALWRGDHVAFPAGAADRSPWSASTNAYDAFAVFSYVAAVTDDVRLGTNICVVPYRHPAHLAKLALTLDSLSAGRFELGAAPGWLESEFAALNVPFEERGSRTDEFLALFDRVCESGEVDLDGPHHSFEALGFYPRPVQDDVPVWIGGDSGASFRRVAEYGDGWTRSMSPDEVRAGRERLLDAWAAFDRDGDPRIAASTDAYVGRDAPAEFEGPLVGTPAEILDGIEDYAGAGTTRIELMQGPLPIDERVDQLERFATDVLAEL